MYQSIASSEHLIITIATKAEVKDFITSINLSEILDRLSN